MAQLPGVPPLVSDYFENFDKVADFYNGDYRSIDAYHTRAQEVKARDLPRPELLPILKEQNQRFGCGAQTLNKLDLLLESRACAVVTGQQTGLFSGPLYTVYKALTAIKLAERLNRTCEGCYVPVFWLASDDHDFREVNHVNIVTKTNEVATIGFEQSAGDSRTPVSQIKTTSEISTVLTALADSSHPSEFKEPILNMLSESYRPDTVFSDAFATLLTHLFKAFGLVLIDPSDPRIKAFARPIFRMEIAEESPSTAKALEASNKLTEQGYHAQVHLKQSFLNLFYMANGRRSIQFKGNLFTVKGTDLSFHAEELLKKVDETPDRFSPNVLLRPIYQDMVLPTVAYVAGPAEISYFAQMQGIFECFDLPMPVIYPRKSLTLLEPKIDKVLHNFDLNVENFWGNPEQLVREILKAQLPESLEKRVENASLCINKNMEALRDVVTDFDPTLIQAVENARGRIENQMEVLEKKILQAYKKRNEVVSQQIQKASNSIHPKNQLQERCLNILQFLFKYGDGFIDQLYEAVDTTNFDHQVVRV